MLSKLKSKLFHTEIGMSAAYYLRYSKPRLNILTAKQTIDYIKKNKCSVARFGDGEFDLLNSAQNNIGFQANSQSLVEQLKRVLSSTDSKLLLCIPYSLNSLWGRTQTSRNFWFYWCERNNNRQKTIDLIFSLQNRGYTFGDSQVTRPYIAWKTKTHADILFPRLKGLWEGKNIIIVEGSKTRLGVGNDLFTEAKSIKRILGPATNAFDHLDEILAKIEEVHTDELVIMALGPTATILAAELSAKGIQAIDIGHVDIEYEWYLRGSKSHDLIPGKYTNEAAQGNNVVDCNDAWYNSQIVARILEK